MFDKIIAQNTSGSDVILGGHSHELIKGVKRGEKSVLRLDIGPLVVLKASQRQKNFRGLKSGI